MPLVEFAEAAYRQAARSTRGRRIGMAVDSGKSGAHPLAGRRCVGEECRSVALLLVYQDLNRGPRGNLINPCVTLRDINATHVARPRNLGRADRDGVQTLTTTANVEH